MALTWVNSITDSLEFLEENSDGYLAQYFGSMKLRFGLLRTLLLFTTRWMSNGKHSNLTKSTLARVEDALSKWAKDLDSYRRRVFEDGIKYSHYAAYRICEDNWDSFGDEINKLCITLAESLSECSTSPSFMTEYTGSQLDSLLDALAELFSWGRSDRKRWIVALSSLQRKVIFLKNFIHFVRWRGVEQRQLNHLLTHSGVLAVNVSRLAFKWMSWTKNKDSRIYLEIKHKVPELVEKIVPFDPPVREIYIQVLRASKLAESSSAQSLEIDLDILGDFVDSLLHNLCELIIGDFSFMPSMKEQMRNLYGELQFLRTILKKQQQKFHELHENMKHLIGITVNEAGILIFSLFPQETKEDSTKGIELGLLNLLESIKSIKAAVENKYPATSIVNFPVPSELGFLDFLIENLKVYSANAFTKDQLHALQEDLIYLRSFFENVIQQHNQHEKLQAIWSRFREVAYKAKIVTDSLVVEDMLDCSPMEFITLEDEIEHIKMEVEEIDDNKVNVEAQKIFKVSNHHVPLQSTTRLANEVVVGLDEEVRTITDHLLGGSMQLDMISIVGMPGLGKTTLAKRVYDDPSVTFHFHIRAWCTISQKYCMKELFLEILLCIDPELYDQYLEMNENDLAQKLFRNLKRKRYLIVLDDMWDSKVWNELKISFPDDANGSRVLMTSRLDRVALLAKPDGKLHRLRRLTDEDSWELLQQKLFHKDGCPPELHKHGKQIAANCNGLPLTVVLIAGILATLERDGWEKIASRLISKTVCCTEQCMDILELSYRHLPNYLKPCLLYFGVFPEDQEIPIWKLIWLWIAEGFVQKTKVKSLEEMAENYMMDLISRSLIMVAKKGSTGRVKTCRIHDLLREFCVAKSKEENFVHLFLGCDELFTFKESGNIRRLSIHPKLFVKSRLLCPGAHSLLFSTFGSQVPKLLESFVSSFCISKLVKVLDLGPTKLMPRLPGEIFLLDQLRYLALAVDFIGRFIPSSIANLSNLETLILHGGGGSFENVLLPATIWTMKKLRHLHLFGAKSSLFSAGSSFNLAPDDHKSSFNLHNLDTCSTLSIASDRNMEEILKMFPNIRRLKCLLSGKCTRDSNNIVAMGFLQRLESLNLNLLGWKGPEGEYIEFRFPLNLKKLTLNFFCWGIISALGKLPNLEVLKLAFPFDADKEWDMKEEGDFPKLIVLKLEMLKLVRWTSSCDHLPCLEKLVLHQCHRLIELPACLGNSSTLEVIELRDCPHSVTNLVRQIEEEQRSVGNEDLKIIIHKNKNRGWSV